MWKYLTTFFIATGTCLYPGIHIINKLPLVKVAIIDFGVVIFLLVSLSSEKPLTNWVFWLMPAFLFIFSASSLGGDYTKLIVIWVFSAIGAIIARLALAKLSWIYHDFKKTGKN